MKKIFNLFVKFAVVFIVFTTLSSNLWADSSNYARGYAIKSSSSADNSGKVYVNCTSAGGTQPATPAANNSSWQTSTSKTSDDAAKTSFDFYFYSLPSSGYALEGWSETDGASDYSTSSVAKHTITTSSSTLNTAYTDFTLYAHFVPNPTVTVTFLTPDSKCSYTAKCNGANVPVGSSIITNKSFDLAATVNDAGYKLLGWYTTTDGGATKSYFSPNDTYTNKYFPKICSVGVDLVEASKPVFMVGDKLFTDLNAANSAASSGSNKTIVLVSDGLLDAGNYTISSGNTLLIPHTIGSTFVNSKSVITEPYIVRAATKLSAFRKLTLQDGVNITVNGNICVAGKMMSAGGGKTSAYPTGECGMIDMSRGGHIELNNGAILYTWGFIKGQDMEQGNNTAGVGTITANSGAVIWEGFATGDWRGGSASSTIYSNADSWKFFPFQSYTIQNIEIPVTYNYGSKLSNLMSIFGDGQVYNGTFDLVGSSNTLFLLKDSGSKLKKWYDPTTDLVCYEMSGTTQLDALNVDAAGETVSSKDYNLPVSTSMHIILASSTTISKPVEIQAGAVVEVKSGATLTCSSNIYLFDKDNWGAYCYKKYYYTMANLTNHKNRGNGTSNELIDDAKFIVDGTLNMTGKMYTTEGGADIMSNGGGKIVYSALPSATNIVMCTDVADNENVAVASANLHNEDDSYTQVKNNNSTFYNVNGRWFVSGKQNEKTDHTYDFTYISSGAVSGSGGTTATTDAVYTWDKKADLDLTQKWHNVSADACANWWVGTDTYFYNWTENSAWHQFIPTATAGMYSGSNNKIYTKTDCTWEELGETDVNCLYTIGDVKKALVDGEFIALEPNNNDPAYHAAEDATKYYICFEGCNWHAADKYTEAEKAYVVGEDIFIWYNGVWMKAEWKNPFFYTLSETDVPIYYEYLNGEWVLAEPYVSVVDGIESRNYWFIQDAFTFASGALRKNPTIKILRDISGITTAVTYTGTNKICTLDLNGHTITGDVNGLITVNLAGCTFTIVDNTEEKEGKISLVFSANNSRRYALNVKNGHVILKSGTISATCTLAYNKTSAPKPLTGCVVVAAGKQFTMDGGKVEAIAPYYPLAIVGSEGAPTITINAGTVEAVAQTIDSPNAIYAYGTINLNGGTVNAIAEKSSTAIGIYVLASSKAQGTLNMTGGTINATSYTKSSRGVYVNKAFAYDTNEPRSITAVYPASANISGGEINATNKTSTDAEGIYSLGNTTVTGGEINARCSANTTAFGIRALAGDIRISGSPVINATATGTVYGIRVSKETPAIAGTVYNSTLQMDGGTINAQATTGGTVYGIYVGAATLANTATHASNSKSYAGNYANAGTATITGVTVHAKAHTNTAYGVFVDAEVTESDAAGYATASATPKCTINGGYFTAQATAPAAAVQPIDATVLADNFKISGGYYSHNGNIDTYAVSPKHAVALQETDAKYDPYFYKVAESYNVTFKNGDETLQSSYQEVGKTPVYSGDAPTKSSTTTTSYIFDGWSATDGGEIVSPLPNVTSAGATYYAHYTETALKYTVTFDAKTNGGAEDAKVVYIEPSAGVGTLPTATKEGYTFNGWFTTATDGTKITTATVPTGDVTYYAQFTVNKYTLTYELGEGKVTTKGTPIPAKNKTGTQSSSVAYGTALTAPVVARTGYTFAGWSPLIAATMPAVAQTYTPQWTPNNNTAYTVKHFLQNVDGTYPTEPTETEALTGTTGESVKPAVKFYDGFTSPATQTKAIAADGSMVIEYQYSRMHYTITLDATTNGGTSEQPTIEVIHGATIGTVPPDAEKGCNDFTGWYTKPVGGVKITSDFTIEYNLKTLYAQFSDDVRKYTITYSAGANGTGSVAAGTKTCGVNTTLSSSTFTRTGYTQTGWSLTDGGAQAYALGAAYTDNDALTLYPFWTVNSYQIKFVDEDGTTLGDYPKLINDGEAVTAPAEPTKNADATNVYTFTGWSDGTNTYASADIPVATAAVTYTATYSTEPTVASVTVGGETTYYTTLQKAFDYAADKTTPTITLLQDVTGLTKQQKYTNTSNTTVTFDLNGHSIEGNVNGFLYLTSDANSGTFNIVDNSAEQTGMVKNVMNYNGTRYCMYVHQGTVNLKGGTIYMQNTNTGTSVCAEGVNVRGSRKFNMTGGKIEVHSTRSAYAVYTGGTTKLSGGKIIANETSRGTSIAVYTITGSTTISGDIECEATGTNNVYGAIVGGVTLGTDGSLYKGTLVIDGGSFVVEATGASGEAYGAYCTANTRAIDYADNATKAGNYADAGTLTIKNGEFTVKGATTYGVGTKAAVSTQNAQDADGLKTTYAKATATPKTTITGGKFDIQGTTKAAVNTTATAANLLIQGGWYSDATNLATKYTAPAKDCNYHVLPLEGEAPYKYEVAEAYIVTFNANGYGTAPEAQAVKDGQKATEPTAPVADGYTFGGWYKEEACTNQWDFATATVTAAQTLYAKWTPTVVSVTVGGETTYYATIAEAWEFVNDQKANTTIKLLQDATTTESLVFTPAAAMTCTLDLNNHTLSGAVSKLININLAKSTFIITDSSEDKNGKVLAEYSVNARLYGVYLTAGTLNLEAGTIHTKNAIAYTSNKSAAATGLYITAGQTFTMDGGTIESESQYSAFGLYIAKSTSSKVTINDGLIKGHTTSTTTAYGIYNYCTKLTINGGHIIGHAWTNTSCGLYQYGKATINGGTIEATNDTTQSKGSTKAYGIYGIYYSTTYNGAVTIPSTSTVKVLAKARTNTAYAVYIPANSNGNTIDGGTFTAIAKTGKTAIGLYNLGGTTVSGGTFNVTTKTTTAYGLYATRGTITVNDDPTFNVTAGSTTAYGAFAYGTINAKGGSKYSGTININGGTFNVTSTTSTAYGAYAGLYGLNIEQKTETVGDTIFGQHYMPGIISITDGTFNVKAKTTAAYGIVVAAAKSESGAVGTTARRPTATITGGNFKVESEGDDNATAYATNSSTTATYLVVQGGKYSTKRTNASSTSNIEDKYTAPTKDCNYHALPLTGEDPYKWEVAEAYTVTFKNGDEVLQSTVVKKGATPSYTGAIPTKTEDENYTYTFTEWSPAITAATADAIYTATFTQTQKQKDITLKENGDNDYYDTFKAAYDGKTMNVTYKRQFAEGRWSTMCLPFNVNYATMKTFGMYGCVYEFKYAEGNANVGSGVNLYFSNAKSIEAGKCYIVNANSALETKSKTPFVFAGVTIDLSKDNGAALDSEDAYDNLPGYKSQGTIELVGTLRNGTLQGTAIGNTYMGLKENKIYYPNTDQGSTIWAYRGIFRSTSALNIEKMRIVVDGEDRGELIIDADGDVRAPSGAASRKFIENGVLYIEREGAVYDATGRKVE